MNLDPTLKTEFSNEAQRIEEDALFSGKGHYHAVPRWRLVHRVLGISSALGSTLAALAVLKQWNPSLAIVAAAVSTFAAVILTALRPSEEADRHQRAADRYYAVKNAARIFRNIELIDPAGSSEKLVGAIKGLSESLADIRSGAPIIPRHAYIKARREIEVEKTVEYSVDKPSKP